MILSFKNRGINIDSSNKCALQCPNCMRERYRKANIKIPGSEMLIEDFNKLIKYFKRTVTFCGQVSDPTAYSKLIKALKITKLKNITSWVHTASSHKDLEWYNKAFDANLDAIWVFGLDGLPHESYKYRINQKGEYLFKVMKLAAKKGIKVIWQYIVCSYNENHIDEAKKLAKENNIEFETMYSERWSETDIYKPSNYTKVSNKSRKIYPKCILSKQPLAYTSKGYILPCCQIDSYWEREKSQLKLLEQEHLKVKNNKNIETIVNSKNWKDFFKTLKNDPAETCKVYCGKPFTIKEAMTVL